MVTDIEKFNNLIKEKNIKTVEEMQEESLKLVKSIPNIKEKYERARMIRGDIIENSIILETAFNELLLKTGGENLVIDHKEKTLRLITGTKKELGSLSTFKKRALAVKEIMEKIFEREEEKSELIGLNNFERIAALRDIFAHVPINWFPPELEFNDNPPYKHFFKLNPEWKNVNVACNEFLSLYGWILEAIPGYIRIILLKEKIMSNILFGKDIEDVLKENKETNILK